MLIIAGPTGMCAHDGGHLHPEHQGRIFSAMDGVRALWLEDDIEFVPTPKADESDLLRVHSPQYLHELESFCYEGGGQLDLDTFARFDSFDAARRAAGVGLAAINALKHHDDGVAFVPVRPPGHHAGVDHAMGFCLLNNIAVSAASLTHEGQRVLIVDWDVHHGNGTQAIFWNDPNVLFVSTHQWSLFPDTGSAEEIGGDDALGLTINVPLPPGATGDIVRAAIQEVAEPEIERFSPDWVLVSCGFDAHRDDPLGGMALSAGDFADLALLARSFAPKPGRLALFLEGGYDATAIRTSVTATLAALLDLPINAEAPTVNGPGRRAIDQAKSARMGALC